MLCFPTFPYSFVYVSQYVNFGSNDGLARNKWKAIVLKYFGKFNIHMTPLGNNNLPH